MYNWIPNAGALRCKFKDELLKLRKSASNLDLKSIFTERQGRSTGENNQAPRGHNPKYICMEAASHFTYKARKEIRTYTGIMPFGSLSVRSRIDFQLYSYTCHPLILSKIHSNLHTLPSFLFNISQPSFEKTGFHFHPILPHHCLSTLTVRLLHSNNAQLFLTIRLCCYPKRIE